jgi:hypothetical protein
MTIEITILLSALSVAFGIYGGMAGIRRGHTKDVAESTTQITMVIAKLECIEYTLKEIKSDFSRMQCEIKELRDRLIAVEQRKEN